MGSVEWNDRAFMEISKSDSMRALLAEKAEPIAASCNADAHSHVGEVYKKNFDIEPYSAGVRYGRGTAIAHIRANTALGNLLESKYKILSKHNH